MTTTPTPLPPLAEVLEALDRLHPEIFAEVGGHLGVEMDRDPTGDYLDRDEVIRTAAPYDAEMARLRAELAKFRELAGEAAITLHDLEDEEFRAECMSRLGKDAKSLIEDAATLIMRLAEMLQEATS